MAPLTNLTVSVAQHVEKRILLANGRDTLIQPMRKSVWKLLKKVKIEYYVAQLFHSWACTQRGSHYRRNICTLVFPAAALFTISRKWNNTAVLSASE